MKRAFTLVELLVVVVVLALLIALLAPAIAGAVKSANAARVTAEINNLTTALAQFKTAFSDYPPSRVVLIEKGYYNTADTTALATTFGDVRTDITLGQLEQRTVRYMSKFWPRALCFNTVTTPPPAAWVDYDGDGAFTSVIYLDGGECLAFFLGGMPTVPAKTTKPGEIGMAGFARDPRNPFRYTVPIGTGYPGSSSRTQPLYEFKGDRLADVDGDGFPSYLDSYASGVQGRPYAYFSAYGGNAYDPNDCNLNPNDTLGKTLGDIGSRVFQVNFSVNASGYNNCYSPASSVCVSPGPNPYTSTTPVTSGAVNWQNPQTFQIVSAGADQVFGVAGQFAGNNANDKLPIPGGENSAAGWQGGVCAGGPVIDGNRAPENDNLTSFSAARLNQ